MKNMKYNPEKYDYETIYGNNLERILIQLELFFGNKISSITTSYLYPDNPYNPRVGIEIKAILYKKYRVEFYVEDIFGFNFNVDSLKESRGIGLFEIEGYSRFTDLKFKIDNKTIKKILAILDNYLRLQLPDKYLEYFGWL